jgi:hypothetical protein
MSYTNNPTSILAGAGITVTPTTGTGAQVVTISSSGIIPVAVRVAVVSPVVVSAAADEVISVQVPGGILPVAVTLPAGVLGQVFTIKDGLGLASAAAPINLNPLGVELIDGVAGPAAAIINAPYGSLTLVYDGTQWIIT